MSVATMSGQGNPNQNTPVPYEDMVTRQDTHTRYNPIDFFKTTPLSSFVLTDSWDDRKSKKPLVQDVLTPSSGAASSSTNSYTTLQNRKGPFIERSSMTSTADDDKVLQEASRLTREMKREDLLEQIQDVLEQNRPALDEALEGAQCDEDKVNCIKIKLRDVPRNSDEFFKLTRDLTDAIKNGRTLIPFVKTLAVAIAHHLPPVERVQGVNHYPGWYDRHEHSTQATPANSGDADIGLRLVTTTANMYIARHGLTPAQAVNTAMSTLWNQHPETAKAFAAHKKLPEALRIATTLNTVQHVP
jgi:hypothetical protein